MRPKHGPPFFHNFVIDTAGGGSGGTRPGRKNCAAAGNFGGVHPSAVPLLVLLSSMSTACSCMCRPATTRRIAPSSAACTLADMRARASCVCSALRSAVSVAESERPTTPIVLLVVGEGGPFREVSLVGGRKYAARSAGAIPTAHGSSDVAGSSLSTDVGAGCGRCAITSAGGSWCPHHG